MNKLFNIFLAAFFAWSINIGCLSYAQVETEPATYEANVQQDTKKDVQVLNYEEVQELAEEPIISRDTIYTEQN